jgi:hypothetical protein
MIEIGRVESNHTGSRRDHAPARRPRAWPSGKQWRALLPAVLAGSLHAAGAGCVEPRPLEQDLHAATTQALTSAQPTGSMSARRRDFTMTALDSGQVLVVGGHDPAGAGTGFGNLDSAELYDPPSGAFFPTASLALTRARHTATRLWDGRVLVAGGVSGYEGVSSAEIYDPTTATWTTTGAMAEPRYDHTATLLDDGRVLVVGGAGMGIPRATAELYDPYTGAWSSAGALSTARTGHASARLPDGRVLVTGGALEQGDRTATTEIFEPLDRVWYAGPPMEVPRSGHTATLLPWNVVMVAGDTGMSTLVEYFDPAFGQWSTAGYLAESRFAHTATVAGEFFVVAGGAGELTPGSNQIVDRSSIERFNLQTGGWLSDGALTARSGHAAALLPSGQILFAGGASDTAGALDSAELYQPAPMCSPLTCEDVGNQCGTFSDGCGGTIECGACEPPPPGSCAHSEYETGAPLTPGCSECAATVCSVDGYCCTYGWDGICVAEANDLCEPPGPPPGPGLCTQDTITLPAAGRLAIGPATSIVPLCNGELLYGNRSTNRIIRVDVLTGGEISSFALPGKPSVLEVDPALGLLYVAMDAAAQVVEIDLQTGAQTSIPVQGQILDLAWAPGAGVLASTQLGSFDVRAAVIDGASDTFTLLGALQTFAHFIEYDATRSQIITARRGISPTRIERFSFDPLTGALTLVEGRDAGSNGLDLAISPDDGHLAHPAGGGNGAGYTIHDFYPGGLATSAGQWSTGAYPTTASFRPDSAFVATSNRFELAIFSVASHALAFSAPHDLSGCSYSTVEKVRWSRGGSAVYTLVTCGFDDDAGLILWNAPPL